jgi:hypothetical protein
MHPEIIVCTASISVVMPGLVPGIHAFLRGLACKQDVDGRDIGVLEGRRSSNGYVRP